MKNKISNNFEEVLKDYQRGIKIWHLTWHPDIHMYSWCTYE
ncbi:hypothetical protein [Oceanotoga phage vB_OteS-UFV02]